MYKPFTYIFITSGIISTVLFSSQLTPAQTIPNIQDIAQKTTVQINSDAHPGGSGVIVKKEGTIYTVLTANHVVCDRLGTTKIRCRQDFTYTVRTHDGKEYPIKELQLIQKTVQDPDLALVTFQSNENYQVAFLGNSENLTIRADISVAGFPTIFGRVGKQRSFTITDGKVVTFLLDPPQGYGLVYNATTRIGNSGGPVFNAQGQVIAIHGLADTNALESEDTNQPETNPINSSLTSLRKLINAQPESTTSSSQKTGFNAGIPINILYGFLPRTFFNSTPSPSSHTNPSQLPSSKYTKLETLLQSQNFKEADQETDRIVLALAQRQTEGYLRLEDTKNLSCQALQAIDHLWSKYSQGKFGISTQQQIYQSLGGTTQYNGTIWNSFSEKVGWRKGTWLSSNQLDFSLSAPKGQLPTLGVAELYGESFGLLPPVLQCRI
ncbi:trypsin-like serine protease [Cylindrospermopsis raciborskii CHAB3438]|uniref:GUN4 domain-containing protein n=1 Tax=Cylindrospermopsis raciborskii TaxID=77022 RepID=UPI001F0F7FBB|nr:GUN4 domain-containing protein [Cylindrospermopsis raciborskii]MCH4904934.1 trypsin-like serine protease [Cylindrospermopsis raciborskii CHAB3438]